ncbi:MAG: ABC transporter substrate-binding protein [Sphingomonadales bacterium]
MPRAHLAAAAIALLLTLGSCGTSADEGEIDVSVIGERFRLPDPDRVPLSRADKVLASATAEGLVSFDGNGQVQPGLAESWIVTSDGLSTIFRVRATKWRNGDDISGEDVARSLSRSFGHDSRNPYAPLFKSVDAVIGMTGRVVEIRLHSPRPNLLQLLAQPELGIRQDGSGTGAFRATAMTPARTRLMPVQNEDDPVAVGYDPVLLRTERGALAIARFVAGRSDLVLGGTFAEWPTVRTAELRPGRLRFDPVQGLFGLAFVGKGSFTATSDVRAALAMAVDRLAMADAFDLPGWTTTERNLPAQLDSAQLPAIPDWSGNTFAQRRADAAQRIASWRVGMRATPVLRVALPRGPGMRILFARLAADWAAIGVRAVAVAHDAPDADLRLIDAVAPNASANWYLTTLSCAAGLVCDAKGDMALESSRIADTLAARGALIATADAALASRASFIALGVPLRWSLVDPQLSGWKENVMGIHPLSELRPARIRQD